MRKPLFREQDDASPSKIPHHLPYTPITLPIHIATLSHPSSARLSASFSTRSHRPAPQQVCLFSTRSYRPAPKQETYRQGARKELRPRLRQTNQKPTQRNACLPAPGRVFANRNIAPDSVNPRGAGVFQPNARRWWGGKYYPLLTPEPMIEAGRARRRSKALNMKILMIS